MSRSPKYRSSQRRHLYLRDPHFALVTKARAQLLQALRLYFEEDGCLEIVPPSFTGVQCEGGATLFQLSHPGKSTDKPLPAYLTQSSQFALEMAVPAHGDCYCIAPSFRAEHSHTRRHLTEFLHAEAEWVGIAKFEQHLYKLRALLQGFLRHFLAIAGQTLKQLGKLNHVWQLELLTHDILVLDHRDAIAECRRLEIYNDPETEEHFAERDDIPEAQERALIDKLGRIVFLVRFPKEFKSFYMGLDPEDESRVLGCDVEVPGVGEIVGSGVREADHDKLQARLLESGLQPDDYREYLELRKSGFGMTSGMGLGVDRMLTWLLGESSIRDVVTFPGYLRP
jgi:asparaginyl-tRNA synthetase